VALRYPPIPDEQNAAVGLLNLWEEDQPEFWKAFRRGERKLPERRQARFDPALPFLGNETRHPPRVGALSPASRAAVEEHVRTNAAHLERVRLALQRPRCLFPAQFTDGYAALLPHLAEMKKEAQGFWMTNVLEMDRNDVDKSIASLEDIA